MEFEKRIVSLGIEIRNLRHLVKFLRTENRGLQDIISLQETCIDALKDDDPMTVDCIEEMKLKIGALRK